MTAERSYTLKKWPGFCPAISILKALDARLRGHDSLSLANELRVHIGLQTFDAAFRAVAGLLDAAERRFRRRDRHRVDADHAGLDRIADGDGLRARGGEGIGGETERQRVGALH